MKKWVQKLIEQFGIEDSSGGTKTPPVATQISEEHATLLFVIDAYAKHLLDIEGHPVRKVRETFDEFARDLVHPGEQTLERIMFRFRQYFSAYRLDEYTYVQRTFDDFRGIIWDFVEQLSEDLSAEQEADLEMQGNLEELKEAVEANSIDVVKNQSRRFIDSYMEHQFRREKRRDQRIHHIQKNLQVVRQKLSEANLSMRLDHLTGAFNRKSFDEQLQQTVLMANLSQKPCCLLMLDIDHFKRINDNYGHAVGDFILKECVRTLKSCFENDTDFVARVGGEEFAILLSGHNLDEAVHRAHETLDRIRGEIFIHKDQELRFTISMGIAQIEPGESAESWLKRADAALYKAKNSGRDRCALAEPGSKMKHVA